MYFNRSTKILAVILSLIFCHNSYGQDKVKSAQEQIVKAVESYVDAFNKRDAKKVSQHWASDGQFEDQGGNILVGPEKIRTAFEKQFRDITDAEVLSVTIDRVTLVSDDVAMEDGVAELGGNQSTYTAIHKKENGKWLVHSIRETAVESETEAQAGPLADLEWLVGEWVDQSDDAVVRTSCRWSKNKKFIVNSFNVQVPNTEPMEGTQVIGFDAAKGQIRSWRFDSNGGIGEAVWKRKGKDWVIKTKSVNSNGQIGSVTSVFSVKDEFEFSWKTTSRQLDGEKIPNVGPVNVIRLKEKIDK